MRKKFPIRLPAALIPFFFLILSSNSAFGAACSKRMLAYYGYYDIYHTPAYSYSNIPYNELTHIIEDNVNLDCTKADGTLNVNPAYINSNLIQAAHAAGVKVLMEVANDPANTCTLTTFSQVAASAAYRDNFANNIYNFCVANGYDGADIDWEVPSTAADGTNFTLMVQAIRAKMPSPWIISIAIPALPANWTSYNVPSLIGVLDWFNVMTYDYNIGASGYTALVSPEFQSTGDTQQLGSLKTSLDWFASQGVPVSQLNSGMAFYGYSYANGTALWQSCSCPSPAYLFYGTAIKPYINANGWTDYTDMSSNSHYLLKNSPPGFITYDSSGSISAKVAYSLGTRNLGGVFTWELSEDYDGSSQDLLTAMYGAYAPYCGTPTFTSTPTPTFAHTFIATFTPTATNSPTATATKTASNTSTNTPTATPSKTPSSTSTGTATFTPSNTPTVTNTKTATQTPISTDTSTASTTPSSTPTATSTQTPTVTFTSTASASPSPTFTLSYTSTFTKTPTLSPTATTTTSASSTSSKTPSSAPTGTATDSTTTTPTSSPTLTASATPSPTSTYTPTPSGTPTATTSQTPTRTFSPTPTHTPVSTATATYIPTNTFTATSTISSTPANTLTYTLTATSTLTNKLTASPTATPTSTSTKTSTNTFTVTFTPTFTSSNTTTPTPTHTFTSTASNTATTSATPSLTPTATSTHTSTATSMASGTPTNTFTSTQTHTPSPTTTGTSTQTSTSTVSITPTATSSATPTVTFTPTFTALFFFTFTPSPTPVNTRVILYPNPSDGTRPVHLHAPQWTGPLDIKVQIFTAAFRKVQERAIPPQPAGLELDLNLADTWGTPLASGVYYIVITSSQNRYVTKLLLIR